MGTTVDGPARRIIRRAATDTEAADDEYTRLADTLGGEREACLAVVRAALDGVPGWTDAAVRRLADFAFQRCGEVGQDTVWTILDTVGFAMDIRPGRPGPADAG